MTRLKEPMHEGTATVRRRGKVAEDKGSQQVRRQARPRMQKDKSQESKHKHKKPENNLQFFFHFTIT